MSTLYQNFSDNEFYTHHEVINSQAAEMLPVSEWTNEYLADFGYRIVQLVLTDPPLISAPYVVSPESTWDEQEPGILVQTWHIIEPSLEEAKTHALTTLNSTFDSSLPPVETPDGLLWRPGHSSAAVIRDVAEMAELLGMETVTLTDIHDVEVECSLTEARGISAHIGAAYQTAFLQRAAKRRQITSAETVEAALAVTWDDPA